MQIRVTLDSSASEKPADAARSPPVGYADGALVRVPTCSPSTSTNKQPEQRDPTERRSACCGHRQIVGRRPLIAIVLPSHAVFNGTKTLFMFRTFKSWNAEWRGHQILVQNWWDFLLRGGEELIIDGTPVQQKKGWGKLARELHGGIIDNGKTHQVRVHIGSIDYGIKVGCQIFVDDELIGGDTDKKFVT